MGVAQVAALSPEHEHCAMPQLVRGSEWGGVLRGVHIHESHGVWIHSQSSTSFGFVRRFALNYVACGASQPLAHSGIASRLASAHGSGQRWASACSA
eukprot:8350889-Alexandrium_andersonii.AAC.1